MKKRVLCIIMAAVCCLSLSAAVFAAGTLKEIKAFLNYGVTISYDGQEQTMYDANGNRVYPITYEGTTYVPIRAVSSMLGINVDWDGATKTVLLGDHTALKTRITDLEYYDRKPLTNGHQYRKVDSATDNLGNSYTNPLRLVRSCETNYWETYMLTQDFTTFSGTIFIGYDDRDIATTCNVRIYGDGELLYDSPTMTKGVRPVDFSVDISGVDELKIEINGKWASSYSWLSVYIGNGVLE